MYRIFFLFSKFCTKCLHWVQMPRCWQWGPANMSSVRRGQGCPMMDTAGSTWLQLTHHRAELNPSAKMVTPLRKCMSDRVKNTIGQWEKWGRNAREMSLQTPRWEKKVDEKVLWALEQRFLCRLWKTPYQSRWQFPEENCRMLKAHTVAGLSWRTAVHVKDPCWSRGEVWGGRRVRDSVITFPITPCCSG